MEGRKCKQVERLKKLKGIASSTEKWKVTRNGHSYKEVPRLTRKSPSSLKRMFAGRLIYLTTSCQVLVCLILIQITQHVELAKGQEQANQAIAENSSSTASSTFDLVRLSSLEKDNITALNAEKKPSSGKMMMADVAKEEDLLRKSRKEIDEKPAMLKRRGELMKMQEEQSELYHKRADMQVSGAKNPPVYMSAPKEIKAFQEILGAAGKVSSSGSDAYPHHHQKASSSLGAATKPHVKHEIELVKSSKSSFDDESDLHTAAVDYDKKRKPMKKKKRKPKKAVKKVVIKKKNKKKPKFSKKKLVIIEESKPHSPAPSLGSGHADSYASEKDMGKYYEYRSVPKKGAWNFGYKRGNAKHTIQRKEHGHKSHFKTEVKWADKKGKGHHLFDYSHTDHHHEPKMEEKKSPKKHEHSSYAASSKVGKSLKISSGKGRQ